MPKFAIVVHMGVKPLNMIKMMTLMLAEKTVPIKNIAIIRTPKTKLVSKDLTAAFISVFCLSISLESK